MASGKYAKIINQLPRHLGTEPQYQDKVNAVKAEILSKDGGDAIDPDGQHVELLMARIEGDLATLNNLLLRAANGRRHASLFARIYRRLRSMKDLFETQEKETNLLIESYSQLLAEQYEVEGTTSVRLDTGESITVYPEPKAIVKDRDALRAWAIASGLERSLQLPWMTVNAITKERLLKGEPEPDGVDTVRINKFVLRG